MRRASGQACCHIGPVVGPQKRASGARESHGDAGRKNALQRRAAGRVAGIDLIDGIFDADDGVGLNVKTDPRSTGMGQRIVTAMASKLEASVERDPAHAGTRIVLRFRRASLPATKPASAAG